MATTADEPHHEGLSDDVLETQGELPVIDDTLFFVILLGIALAMLYMHGVLKARRVRNRDSNAEWD